MRTFVSLGDFCSCRLPVLCWNIEFDRTATGLGLDPTLTKRRRATGKGATRSTEAYHIVSATVKVLRTMSQKLPEA